MPGPRPPFSVTSFRIHSPVDSSAFTSVLSTQHSKLLMELYETLPIVPLRDVVVFPHMMMPFVIGRPSSTRALEHALLKDKRIFLAAQHDASIDDPRPDDVYTMGCVANVVQSLKLPDGNIKVLVEGVDRARAVEWK